MNVFRNSLYPENGCTMLVSGQHLLEKARKRQLYHQLQNLALEYKTLFN